MTMEMSQSKAWILATFLSGGFLGGLFSLILLSQSDGEKERQHSSDPILKHTDMATDSRVMSVEDTLQEEKVIHAEQIKSESNEQVKD